MTVKEFIDILKELDGNKEIYMQDIGLACDPKIQEDGSDCIHIVKGQQINPY